MEENLQNGEQCPRVNGNYLQRKQPPESSVLSQVDCFRLSVHVNLLESTSFWTVFIHVICVAAAV